jgi:hypothetical protein
MLLNRRQESLELGSTHDERDAISPKWGGMDCRDSCHMEYQQRIPRLSETSAASTTQAMTLQFLPRQCTDLIMRRAPRSCIMM